MTSHFDLRTNGRSPADARALEVIARELDLTMALTGVQRAAAIRTSNRQHVLVPRNFEGEWV